MASSIDLFGWYATLGPGPVSDLSLKALLCNVTENKPFKTKELCMLIKR